MRLILQIFTISALILGLSSLQSVQANVVVGQMAPTFRMADIQGKMVSLKDFQGKTVVLEWTNAECPFVKKHYGTNNMQATQKAAVDGGAVWISVNSSAEGKQGHLDADGARALIMEQEAYPSHVVLDPMGELGRLYGAVTTPHMFVIDADGTLVYAGAIDDNSSANPAHVKGAKNYVMAALDDLSHGKAVAEAQTQPYGCGVKY